MRQLLRGGSPDRVGRNQHRVWRALVGYGRLTTRQLFEHVYPRADLSKRQPNWRWMAVRYAAERYAVRVEPRTRPLRWRIKAGVPPDDE